MRNHLCCSALVLLMVFGCGWSAAQCRWGEGCACLQCPAGHEPSKPCEQVHSQTQEVQCRSCRSGTFSESSDSQLCRPHTSCQVRGQERVAPGTANSDVVCGDCLPGFQSKTTVRNASVCVKSSLHLRRVRTVEKGPGAGGPVNDTVVRSAEEKTAEYAVFALVPIFCVVGLLGILICNILKKKGYRCNADKEGVDAEAAAHQKEGNNYPYISDDLNDDTISVLVRLITEKKENAAALEELLQEYESKQMALSKSSLIKFPMLSSFCTLPRLCPHQSHLHTISGLSGLGPKHGYRCSRCAQRKWPPVLMAPVRDPPPTFTFPSLHPAPDQTNAPLLAGMCASPRCTRVPNGGQEREEEETREGEPRVLSVGRFQVAHIPEYKPVVVETKAPSQEQQRKSLFGGIPFSPSSLANIIR
ncbi:tumor necrosis factor receptor superfamily member 19L isoform X1 [Nerophis lumbriciformis]|uniref:tumor necrosis factor receptor superfamily member 19L isoform X1 n=1 Tax=Nerophis lumbriciformis TaxID=546530 RepID=UPI002AE0796F|nr:tumor necrosis factor receptor superfamily member 19L-like isoform X1 [Nerophis lumbriciformis]